MSIKLIDKMLEFSLLRYYDRYEEIYKIKSYQLGLKNKKKLNPLQKLFWLWSLEGKKYWQSWVVIFLHFFLYKDQRGKTEWVWCTLCGKALLTRLWQGYASIKTIWFFTY